MKRKKKQKLVVFMNNFVAIIKTFKEYKKQIILNDLESFLWVEYN